MLGALVPYIIGAIKGFGAGATAALIGILKKEHEEPIDGEKAVKTIIIGGIIGACTEGLGMPIDSVEQYLALPIVVYAVDAIAKGIWRKVIYPLYKALRTY